MTRLESTRVGVKKLLDSTRDSTPLTRDSSRNSTDQLVMKLLV